MKTQKMTAYERNHELEAVMHLEVKENFKKLQKAVDIMNELGELDKFAELALEKSFNMLLLRRIYNVLLRRRR